jgi:hypothetical protein
VACLAASCTRLFALCRRATFNRYARGRGRLGALKQTNVCAQSKKTNCRHPATWRDRFGCHGARRYCSLGRDRVAVVGRASGAALTARRFPPPWIVEELDACFVVRITTDRRSLTSITRKSQDGSLRRSCRRRTRREGSQRTLLGCQSY